MGNFKKWLERTDPFGFEEDDVKEKLTVQDDQPHDQFPIEYIANLLKKRQFNGKQGFSKFSGEVMWGLEPGALKVEFGPEYQVYIERKISSMDGDPTWITKKVIRIDVDNYRDTPDTVEDSIAKEIQKVAQGEVEAPYKDIPEEKLEELVLATADAVQTKNSKFFFYEKTKKTEPLKYIIQLGAAGGGTGSVLKSSETNRINSILIELAVEKDKGVIRCLIYTEQSGEGNRYFVPQPSFFDARFSIDQSQEEIVEAITSSLKFY